MWRRLLTLILLWHYLLVANAQTYNGTTLAGSPGVAGVTDATGASARFSTPLGTEIDDSGNIYVADSANKTIRKIVSSSGVVTTLAGANGQAGTTDATGASARFTQPRALTVDNDGSVYVSEANHVIRKVTAAGVTTTYAGAANVSGANDGKISGAPKFSAITHATTDSSGNIYVADTTNNLIRKITSAGVVTTFAGNGDAEAINATGTAASFNAPTGVVADSSDNIYVADKGNNLVRKITSAGVVTTLAGNGDAEAINATGTAASFNQPWGLGVDSLNNIYVADKNNHLIRKITTAGVVTTYAGATGVTGTTDGSGTDARFNNPTAIAFDTADKAYVADETNNTIRKIVGGGSISTLAGSAGLSGTTDATGAAARFKNPTGIAKDSSDNLYVTDTLNNTIRKITSAGVTTTIAGSATAGTPGRLSVPHGIVEDSSGNLYVSDNPSHTIRKIATDGTITTFAGTAGQAGATNGTGPAARFRGPGQLVIDASDNIYVGDNDNHCIRKITPAALVSTFAGTCGSAGFNNATGTAAKFYNPVGLAMQSNGNIYVADANNHCIRKVSSAGVVTTLAGSCGSPGYTDATGTSARFRIPQTIAVTSNGSVFVSGLYESSHFTVRKITPAGVVTTFAGTSGQVGTTDGTGAAARFQQLGFADVDGSDNIYVADFGNHTIRKITPAAVVTTVAGNATNAGYVDDTGTSAKFNRPLGVVVAGDGSLYVTEYNNHTVRKITIPGAVVTTFAGVAGVAGTNDTIASPSVFKTPYGITTDSDGNIYVADTGNHALRKITPAGIVTLVAGNPGISGSTDSSTGAAASRFNSPTGSVVDSNGNIFIADQSNHVIRKIAPSGKVTIFAGYPTQVGSADGTGSAARFNQPAHITVDNADALYVTDYANHTIRKITKAGVVTTLAGQAGVPGTTDSATATSARFRNPVGIWADSSKNIYVADSGNHTIRKISNAGVVTTVAGGAGVVGTVDGTAGNSTFYAPMDIAIDSSDNLYVTDLYNNTIRKITSAGVVTTFAGTTGASGTMDGTGVAARFSYPKGITVDSSDNLYVTDSARIRKVTAGAVVTTFAGGSTIGGANGTGTAAQFHSPQEIAVSSNGNLFLVDSSNHNVRKITPAGVVTTFVGPVGCSGCAGSWGSTDGTGSAARFLYPSGIAIDSSDNLYVSDSGNHTIRKVTPAGVVTTFAGSAGSSGSTNGTGSAARFGYPFGIGVDSSDNLYVSDSYNHTVRKITPGAVVTTFAGSAGLSGSADGTGSSARFLSPNGLVVDSSDNIFVADEQSTIRKITSSAEVTTFAGIAGVSGSADSNISTARFNSPNGITGDNSTGSVYVADKNNHTLRKVTSSGVVTTISGAAGVVGSTNAAAPGPTAARFNLVEGTAVDSSGNIFVADHLNHTIRKIGTDNTVTTFAGSPGVAGSTDGASTSARFRGPAQIAIDSSNNIYVADYYNHTIRKVEANGDVTTFAGSAGYTGTTDDNGSAARFNNPHGIAVDSSGYVYVADRSNHSVRKITPTGLVSTLAGTSGSSGSADGNGSLARFNQPMGISQDAAGNLYVADYGNNTIRKVTSTGSVTTMAGAAGLAGSADGSPIPARFYRPHGMARDANGNIFVVDNPSHTIRKITPQGVVTTFAGSAGLAGSTNGTGLAARFYEPADIAIASNGTMFVADNMNHCIRKVTTAAVVSDFAGNCGAAAGNTDGTGTAARFKNPIGIEINGTNLYVADSENSTIRKITMAGVVTTYAGTKTVSGSLDSGAGGGVPAQFNYPHGLTIDDNGKLFIVDNTNHTLRTIDDNGVVATLAGSAGQAGSTNATGSSARFSYPQAVAKSSNGSIFVTDYTNNLLRKITEAGVVTTLAGNGDAESVNATGTAASFNKPVGIYVDSSDYIYVVDHYGHCIRKVTQAGVVTTFAGLCGTSGSTDATGTSARFNNPYMISGDGTNYLYVTDRGNETVRRIDIATADVTTIAGAAGSAGYIDGGQIPGKFNYPAGLAKDSSGNIYVADTNNRTIRKISPSGYVTTFAGSPGASGTADGTGSAARFTYPADIVVASNGNLFVADHHAIRKITPSAVVTTFAGSPTIAGYVDATGTSARFNSALNLTIDGSDNLYVGDSGNHIIRKVTPAAVVTTYAGVANSAGSVDGSTVGALAKFNYPSGVVTSSNGSIFVVDNLNHIIRKVATNGDVTTFAGSPGVSGYVNDTGSAARFNQPQQIAIDSSDNLYVSDGFGSSHTIRKITQAGLVTTLAGSGSAGSTNGTGTGASFYNPVGVWATANGNLFIADHYNHCIRKIVISSGVTTTFAGTCGSIGSTDGTGAAARFYYPYGMAGDSSDNLYVADENNHTVRKITKAGVVTTLAGKAGTAGSTDGSRGGRFYQPHDVVFASNGTMFVSDQENHLIRKVATDGTVSTFAGLAGTPGSTNGTGSAARFNGLGGMAIDGSDNIYVGDNDNHCVRKITPAAVVSTFVGLCGTAGYTNATGTAARFTYPAWVTMSSNGSLYIADMGNHVIRKATSGGVVTTLAGSGSAGCTDGTGTGASFRWPQGMAEASNGSLFVAETYIGTGNQTIRKVTPAGVVTTFAGSCGQSGSTDATGSGARFNAPVEISIDGSDNLYVSDFYNHTIRKITPSAVVTTIAGTAGSAGSTDATGTSARFYHPLGTDIDPSGDLYLAEYSNHTIRKITLPGAVVTTFAGQAGNSGNSNSGESAARFNTPTGIAVDASNNVYVSEWGNHTLRKVTPSGTVSTLAGASGTSGSADGTGSAAGFYIPVGMVANGSNIYVADHYNSTIRKVTTSGVATTVAGVVGSTGSSDGTGARAKFNFPRGVAYSANGSLFVSDSGNSTIRKINSSGDVTTLAGTAGVTGTTNATGSAARFSGPYSLRTDSSNNIYVTDSSNHTIRKITAAGVVTTLAGTAGAAGSADGSTSGARFYLPMGLYIDGSNNIFISDYYNHTIRKSSSVGVVTTIAGVAGSAGSAYSGGSSARFNSPVGITVGDNNNLYVTEWNNHTIRKISSGGTVTTLAGTAGTSGTTDATGTNAKFFRPTGITYDAGSSSLYVSDHYNHSIRKITTAGVVTTAAGIHTLSGSNDGDDVGARFNKPTGLVFDTNGNLFVADKANHTIRKITTAGAVTTIAGAAGVAGSVNDTTGTNARFNWPSYLTRDSSNNLFVSDFNNRTIRKITPAGEVTLFAGSVGTASSIDGTAAGASFNYPAGLVADASNNIYVSEYGGHVIRKATSSAVVTTIAGVAGSSGSTDSGSSSSRLNGPMDTAALSDGSLIYVADYNNHTIRRITSAGVVGTLAGTAGTSGSADGSGAAARFYRPYSIALDASNNMYVGDSANHTVRKVTSVGAVTTIAGSAGSSGSQDTTNTNLSARYNYPTGIGLDGSGNLYISEYGNYAIRKLSSAGAVTTIAGVVGTSGSTDGTGADAKFFRPNSLVVNGSYIYIPDTANHTIRKLVISSTEVTTLAGLAGASGYTNNGGGALFKSPRAVTIDSSGNLYVADTGNYTIRKIDTAGTVTTYAGTAGSAGITDGTGSDARFDSPWALTRDSSDNIYVADKNKHTIRKIASGAVVTTFAGTAGNAGVADGAGTTVAKFTFPTGLTVDSADNIWVIGGGGSTNSSALRKISPAGVVTTVLSFASAQGTSDGAVGSAQTKIPYSLVLDSSNNVFMTDELSHTIRKLAPNGVTVSTFAGSAGSAGINNGTGTGAKFNRPTAITIDSSDNIYVADKNNHAIRKITSAAVVSTFAGLLGSSGSDDGQLARFNSLSGLAVDSSNNIYVADTNNYSIRKVTSSGVATTHAGSPGVSGNTNGTGVAARFASPYGLAMDAAGSLYVADKGNNSIRKISSSGVVTTIAGSSGIGGSTNGNGTAARFNGPHGIAFDSAGNLIVADADNHTIRKITPAAVVTTIAGSAGVPGNTDATGSSARFDTPTDIAIDAQDNIYVTDSSNHTIRKVTSTAAVTTVAGTAGTSGSANGVGSIMRFNIPWSITLRGSTLYITDRNNHTVRKIQIQLGTGGSGRKRMG